MTAPTLIVERRLQILQILTGSGLVVFGIFDVNGGGFLWGFLFYLPVGIPIALLMAVGLSVGRRGAPAVTIGAILVTAMAILGALGPWPIPLPGGSLWWWPLLAVAVAAVVMTLRLDLPAPVQAPPLPVPPLRASPPAPRLRWAVVGAQGLIAWCGISVVFDLIENAHGIGGIVVPAFLIPVALVLIAGAAYGYAVRWPVIVTNVPLFLYAVLVAAGTLAHPSESQDPQGLGLLAVVATATAFSAYAALLPPRSPSQAQP